ncbi:MAG: hypothetical protein JWR90_2464 [Marmoricola sp.]|jgi:hypothetical protein|nr:hypothetical protein [Marmoricola sp.]
MQSRLFSFARCPAGHSTAVCCSQRDSADLRHVLRLGSDTRVWEPRGCSLRSDRAAGGPASPAENWARAALSAVSGRSPLGVLLGPGSHHRRRFTLTSCIHTAEIVKGLWLILRESR